MLLHATRRVALVVGINDYSRRKLRRAVHDANAIAWMLLCMGFFVVLITDANINDFDRAANNFCDSLGPGDVAFFYFAGHGVEASVNGKVRSNWLLAKEVPQTNAMLPDLAINVSGLLKRMEAKGTRFNAMMLDCCRDDALAAEYECHDGLPTYSPVCPNYSLVVFACAPGERAAELPGESHAVFTKHLLKHLPTPNLPVVELFELVRKGVNEDTKTLSPTQDPCCYYAPEVEHVMLFEQP